MKFLILIFNLFVLQLYAQNTIKIISWNVLNLGFYTSNEKISFIVSKIKEADLVVLQEIKSNKYGTEDLKKLVSYLNIPEKNWEYTLSGATSGLGHEQYAYVWKKNKLKLKQAAWLDQNIEKEVDREPYLARFEYKNKNFTLANFHAVPKKKAPWEEIKHLPKLHAAYFSDNMIFCGDFNLSYKNNVYAELYKNGYQAILKNQKTTIKAEEKNGEHLANELDNFFVEIGFFNVADAGVIDFTKQFSTLKQAREMSDHLPIYLVLSF